MVIYPVECVLLLPIWFSPVHQLCNTSSQIFYHLGKTQTTMKIRNFLGYPQITETTIDKLGMTILHSKFYLLLSVISKEKSKFVKSIIWHLKILMLKQTIPYKNWYWEFIFHIKIISMSIYSVFFFYYKFTLRFTFFRVFKWIHPLPSFCSIIWTLDRLDGAAAYQEGPSASLSSPIWMLISSGNTLTDTHRNVVLPTVGYFWAQAIGFETKHHAAKVTCATNQFQRVTGRNDPF